MRRKEHIPVAFPKQLIFLARGIHWPPKSRVLCKLESIQQSLTYGLAHKIVHVYSEYFFRYSIHLVEQWLHMNSKYKNYSSSQVRYVADAVNRLLALLAPMPTKVDQRCLCILCDSVSHVASVTQVGWMFLDPFRWRENLFARICVGVVVSSVTSIGWNWCH